jgi:hypothetical protein
VIRLDRRRLAQKFGTNSGDSGSRIKYPPQFKIGFMSNNPPVYDLLPQMQKLHQKNMEEQGPGRPTP